MTPAGGQAVALAASEEMVLDGLATPTARSYIAPEPDEWDRWNYARTDHLLDALSARYVPPGTYGVDALDQYGNWRDVPTYGPVWVPQAVAPGWVPYSTEDHGPVVRLDVGGHRSLGLGALPLRSLGLR